jgi:hypothetical protein
MLLNENIYAEFLQEKLPKLRRNHLGAFPTCIVMISNDLGSFRWLNEVIQRRETNIMLCKFVFALELYRREHDGKYPESLDELRNGYMDELPLDPFSQQPFLYVLDEDRCGCLIYSVGSNGIDENGRNNNDTPRGDDVRRRIRSIAD